MKFCPRCAAPLVPREAGGKERLACPDEACRFVFWDNPLPVVAAIVEHQDGVVLVRAHGWPDKMFGLVTGFLERDESPEEGVLREVREELGLAAEVVRLIGVYPFPQRNELIVAYHVRARGSIALGAELAAFKVVPEARLRPWPFGTGLAVRDWLGSRGAGQTAREE